MAPVVLYLKGDFGAMHFCTYLITDEIPTNAEINEILKPWHDDEADETAPFTFDYFEVGGRYNGLLKLKTEGTMIDYKFGFIIPEPRAGRLFRSLILEELQQCESPYHIQNYWENHFWGTFGRRDGYIHVDGCKLKDLANFDYVKENGYCFIDIDKTVLIRDRWDRKKMEWVKDDTFDEKKSQRLEKRRDGDCFITILDIHD